MSIQRNKKKNRFSFLNYCFMSRLFICSVVPNEYIVTLKASQAANNFCNRLIDGNCFDNIYSLLPISYNILPHKDNKITYFANKGTNVPSKLFGFLINTINVVKKAKNYDDIWFYNINNSNAFVFLLLKIFFRKRQFVIMADYTPSNNIFSFQYFIGKLINIADGIISLSSRSCFKFKRNQKIIPGIIDDKMLFDNVNKNNKIVFLFSGTLSKTTGFEMALKTFSKIPQAQLYISGNGSFVDDYAYFKNIHFMGNLEYDKYLELLNSSTVCLNFRDPMLAENNNNFPSKILDYFSRGKIVLSTIRYPEINGANYLYCSFNETSIISIVNKILKMPISELERFSNNKDFLKKNFSLSTWKKAFKTIELNRQNEN